MYILVYPLLDGTSAGGKDKKSISDLKKIIPREASSRGAIINTTDLQNFFNSINDNSCKLYFSKKRVFFVLWFDIDFSMISKTFLFLFI